MTIKLTANTNDIRKKASDIRPMYLANSSDFMSLLYTASLDESHNGNTIFFLEEEENKFAIWVFKYLGIQYKIKEDCYD